MAWNASSASLHSPYQDVFAEGRASEAEYDPYNVNAVGRSSSGQRL